MKLQRLGFMETKKILIDPGHGGNETGAVYKDLIEKDINLRTALKLKSLLSNNNFEAFLTRYEDRELTLRDRVEIANRIMPDLFISIHHNSSYEDVENRIEVYYRWEEDGPSYKFSEILTRFLEKYLKIPSLKPFPAFYTVLRNNCPISILVEPYYIKYYKPDLPELVSIAIYEAIKEFFKWDYPIIGDFELKNNFLILNVKGRWDAEKSIAKIDNERVLIEKRENKAYIYITRSGNLEVILRNYNGHPSNVFKMKINNIFKSYLIDIFPGFRNMPNLVNISFYDVFFQKLSDNFNVKVILNNIEYEFFTKDGKISFIADIQAKFYEIKIKVMNYEFKEVIELNEGFMYWGKIEGVWDGYGVFEDRIYKIFNQYIFSNVPKLKIIARGFQTIEVDLSKMKFYKPEKLFEGIFHNRRIVIIYDFLDVAYELASRLWFFGADVLIFRYEDELNSIKKVINFKSEILLFFKYSDSEIIKFYEMDKYGQKLSTILSNRLKLFNTYSSYQILIQPFGARVILELKSLDDERVREIIFGLKEYLETIQSET
ncbi:MAG: N-acetylmuramoyl-L-alanine amidase [candidate division WOR-3 bacterium]